MGIEHRVVDGVEWLAEDGEVEQRSAGIERSGGVPVAVPVADAERGAGCLGIGPDP
jgi:hypothetical protein